MALNKNLGSQKMAVFAWDTVNNVPKTGDDANITARIDKDGAGAAQTNDVNPTEADATDMKGIYYFDLTKAETNANLVTFSAVSSTPDILLDPVFIYTSSAEKIIDRNADLIESQRGMWTWQGNYFYVDPVNGDTHASGRRGGRDDPYADVQDCHDNAVTAFNHDVIFLVAGGAGVTTTLTTAATVTLSKEYTSIRGPGRDFLWTRSGAGDTIDVTGEGIELSGFRAEMGGVGSGDAILITGDHARVVNIWSDAARRDAIHVTGADWTIIEDCQITGAGVNAAASGIHVDGSSANVVIRRVRIFEQTGDGITLGGTAHHTVIEHSIIQESSEFGINISVPGVDDTVIANNCLHNNTSGNIRDNGVDTATHNNEQYLTQDGDFGTILKASLDTSNETTAAITDALITAAFTEIKGATWSSITDTLEAIRDAIDAVVGLGSGGISVNHDTGGTDNLAYKTGAGAGIDNATVRAYLKTDYDAGSRTDAFVKGLTTTTTTGRWSGTMRLDAATYTFEFSKQGEFGPDTKEQAVS